MNKYARIAWQLAFLYTIGAIVYLIAEYYYGTYSTRLIYSFMIMHVSLFAIFFLAYKMQIRFFAFLSAAWFGLGFINLPQKLVSIGYCCRESDSVGYAILGAFTALAFMAIMIYFSLRIGFKRSSTCSERNNSSKDSMS